MKTPALIWAEYTALRLALIVASVLPVASLPGVAYAVGSTAYFMLRPLRRRCLRHLRFSALASSDRQAARIARKTFIQLTLTALEILKSEQVFRRHPAVETFAPHSTELERIVRNGAGYIAVCAHYGNWEFAACLHGLKKERLHCVYRPLDNPHINRWMTKRRESFGQKLVAKRGALRHLLRAIRNGEGVCILADQHSGRVEGTTTTFFGQPASTHTAPALLKLRTDAPLFVVALRRTGQAFRYEYVVRGPLEIEPTGDRDADVQSLAQLYTSAIEEIIREDPTQWLWPHRRWPGVRPVRRRSGEHRVRTGEPESQLNAS